VTSLEASLGGLFAVAAMFDIFILLAGLFIAYRMTRRRRR
jgi:hypothetical protein